MTKRLAALTMMLLGAIAPLHAHHSVSMFDISTPVWVKGTVVSYEAVNPHAIVTLMERGEDGQVRRWTVEGPSLAGLKRMEVDAQLLKAGDVIEFCGFALKESLAISTSSPDTDASSPRFVHGHLLLLPNGEMKTWGSYGKLQNCVRPRDSIGPWVDFLSTNPIARDRWCFTHRPSVPTSAGSRALVDEIDRRIVDPCG